MITKVPKIQYATINDELRPILGYILLTKEEIAATDAHILVVHKTKDVFNKSFIESMPDRCLVSAENWKILCKGYFHIEYINAANCIKIVSKNGNIFLINVEFEDDIKMYPDYSKVFEAYEQGDINSVGISPKFLYNLSLSMDGGDSVELNFHAKNKGILVKSEKAKGLIMPRIIDFE